jgi:hypothetical protein
MDKRSGSNTLLIASLGKGLTCHHPRLFLKKLIDATAVTLHFVVN